MDNKYINEERYLKTNKRIKIISIILIIIGLLFLVSGLVLMIMSIAGLRNNAIGFVSTSDLRSMDQMTTSMFGSFGLFTGAGFLIFIGFTSLMFGVILSLTSHRREITAYRVTQTMPIVKEATEEMTPTAAKAAGTVAKEVTIGIKEGIEISNKKNNKK